MTATRLPHASPEPVVPTEQELVADYRKCITEIRRKQTIWDRMSYCGIPAPDYRSRAAHIWDQLSPESQAQLLAELGGAA